GVGVPQSRLLRRDLRLRLLELCSVLILLDREEKVAFLHSRSVRERNLLEVAFYPRYETHGVGGSRVSGEVQKISDSLTDGFGDGHCRRRRRVARVAATSGGNTHDSWER